MQSRLTYKEYGAIKIYNKENDKWTYIRPINIGDIKQSVSQKDHNGWMICNGRSLNKIDYPLLYNLIGISFGGDVGVGGTFKLPDARGRVSGSIGQGSDITLTNRTMGSYVGSETHTMTVAEMPTHSHDTIDPGHSHSYTNNINDANPAVSATTTTVADNADLPAFTGSSQTGITIAATGSGQEFDIMQPTVFIANTFIYAFST